MFAIENVWVAMPEGMTQQEAEMYAREEIEEWKANHKRLDRIILELDGDEVIVKAIERSPIRRIRRITGYLSEASNFNDGKQAELAQRKCHFN